MSNGKEAGSFSTPKRVDPQKLRFACVGTYRFSRPFHSAFHRHINFKSIFGQFQARVRQFASRTPDPRKIQNQRNRSHQSIKKKGSILRASGLAVDRCDFLILRSALSLLAITITIAIISQTPPSPLPSHSRFNHESRFESVSAERHPALADFQRGSLWGVHSSWGRTPLCHLTVALGRVQLLVRRRRLVGRTSKHKRRCRSIVRAGRRRTCGTLVFLNSGLVAVPACLAFGGSCS